MERAWVTTGSTTTGSVVDPFVAACHQGYVPDALYFVENPTLEESDELIETLQEVAELYGEELDVNRRTVESETSFDEIYLEMRDSLDEAKDAGAEVAVNFTPGRKYMSSIAFQTAMNQDADHVYYLHIEREEHYGEVYHNIPRTAATLYDFTEEI